MSTYLISYDLRKPGRNYADLHEAIKSFGTWAHPLESLWAVVSNLSSQQIRDFLLTKMDANDGLLVVKSANSGAWSSVGTAPSEWLKAHL